MYKKEFTNRGVPVVASAVLRFARVAPRKARMVAALIRDKSVGEALNILRFTVKPSAQPYLIRLLQSAVANVADDAVGDKNADLSVGEVLVDGAVMMKRFRPAPMGRAVRIRKRSSHMTIHLTKRA